MTDVFDGDRVNEAIERARATLDDLREALAETAAEVGAAVNAKIDAVQDAIDAIQAAIAERPRPDNTLPGDLPPQPEQLPADQP